MRMLSLPKQDGGVPLPTSPLRTIVLLRQAGGDIYIWEQIAERKLRTKGDEKGQVGPGVMMN